MWWMRRLSEVPLANHVGHVVGVLLKEETGLVEVAPEESSGNQRDAHNLGGGQMDLGGRLGGGWPSRTRRTNSRW